MLEIRVLNVSVDGQQILKNVNLDVNLGEVHAIMGPETGAARARSPTSSPGRPGLRRDWRLGPVRRPGPAGR